MLRVVRHIFAPALAAIGAGKAQVTESEVDAHEVAHQGARPTALGRQDRGDVVHAVRNRDRLRPVDGRGDAGVFVESGWCCNWSFYCRRK